MRSVIWLQTPTLFWIRGRTISFSSYITLGLRCKVYEMHTAVRLVPQYSAFLFEMSTEKLNTKNQVLIKFQQILLK
jgi:hypothetical protein